MEPPAGVAAAMLPFSTRLYIRIRGINESIQSCLTFHQCVTKASESRSFAAAMLETPRVLSACRWLETLKKTSARSGAGFVTLAGLLANWTSIRREGVVVGEPIVHRDRWRTVEPGEKRQFLQVVSKAIGALHRRDVGSG